MRKNARRGKGFLMQGALISDCCRRDPGAIDGADMTSAEGGYDQTLAFPPDRAG